MICSGFKPLKSIILAIILIIPAMTLSAQESNKTAKDTAKIPLIVNDSSYAGINTAKMPKWYEMITNIPGDWAKFWNVTWNEDKIPLYLTVAALTASTIATDEKTWREVRKIHDRTTFNRKFDEFWTAFGDGRTQFELAFAFGAYGLITSDVRAVRTGSETVQAVLASGSVVQVMKHITGRENPNTETQSAGIWRFFPNQIDYAKHVSVYDAFPSGHVTTTLATVIVIAENYPEIWWIRPLGYLGTACLAWGMVGTGIHWFSDYPLAVALGYTFGMIAAHPEGIPAEIAGKKINIMPTLVNRELGLSFGYSF